MDTWILRLSSQRWISNGIRSLAILHVTASGRETELDVQSLGSSTRLGEVVRDQIQQGRARLILDLSAVSKLDEVLLGAIVAGFDIASHSEAVFVVAGLNPWNRDIFQAGRLDSVIPAFTSLPEALDYVTRESSVQSPAPSRD